MTNRRRTTEVIRRIREGRAGRLPVLRHDAPVPLADIAAAYKALRERKAVKYLIDLRP